MLTNNKANNKGAERGIFQAEAVSVFCIISYKLKYLARTPARVSHQEVLLSYVHPQHHHQKLVDCLLNLHVK